MIIAVLGELELPATANAESGDPGDPWHITMAVCIIGTIILFGAIYFLLREKE